ncbi:MAG TPA: hypothetical protein VGC93_12035 [Thermoanaerobaculia bacterium]
MNNGHSLLGVGIYTVPEAARLTGVSAGRIRRWLRGYAFRSGNSIHESPRVWIPDLPVVGDTLALSFRDLMEVRFVDYFLEAGVTWKTLRNAAAHAAERVDSTHPFSTRLFKTNGYTIFHDYVEKSGERNLLEVITEQFAIPSAVEPYLYKGLEFSATEVVRWFPLSPRKRIVIDPAIGFGQPTVTPEGVPTAILARAAKVEPRDRVAKWYRVRKAAVADAVEYEEQLAAA